MKVYVDSNVIEKCNDLEELKEYMELINELNCCKGNLSRFKREYNRGSEEERKKIEKDFRYSCDDIGRDYIRSVILEEKLFQIEMNYRFKK